MTSFKSPLPAMMLPFGLIACLVFAGCAPLPGTITTIVGTGTVYTQGQKHKYQREVGKAVDRYIADHAESPCAHGEDKVLESAVDVLKRHNLSGYEEVMARLEVIYQDSAQEQGVRAAALYNMAILNSRKLEPNKPRAREYLKRLYIEFPNHYRCIFDESAWRDSMIEQQLLYPGETVESFLEDAERDIERRSESGPSAQE